MNNLLANIPAELPQELLESLVDSGSVHIERIVSRGHRSPPEDWYDQEKNEWVMVLQGAARLVFADGRELSLGPGDWVNIAARDKHRVSWTHPETATVWLAVHYS
jgi:cupin 2 domain-containing protein